MAWGIQPGYVYVSFNSLFEMLYRAEELPRGEERRGFNSLFEMPTSTLPLKVSRGNLSFNSLFEMLELVREPCGT